MSGLHVIAVEGLPEIDVGRRPRGTDRGGGGARRRRRRRGDVEGGVEGRGCRGRARQCRTVGVRGRIRPPLGQGSPGRRGRAATGEAGGADGGAGADHGDQPRVRVRQQRRRPVLERGGGAGRGAARRSGRVRPRAAPALRRPRRRRGRRRQRHVRAAVAGRADRRRGRDRRDRPDGELHRPARPARPRVPGAGAVRGRRAGRRGRAGEGEHQPDPGGDRPGLQVGARRGGVDGGRDPGRRQGPVPRSHLTRGGGSGSRRGRWGGPRSRRR